MYPGDSSYLADNPTSFGSSTGQLPRHMAWRDDVTRDVATVGLTRTKSLGLAVVIRVSAHVEV